MTDEIDVVRTPKVTAVKLTPQQKAEWGDTMSLMAWTAPGFRHLWYKLLANNEGEYIAIPTRSSGIPVAATDGRNILINPDTFFKYSLKERVFIGAHEVVHNVYDDVNLLHRLHGQTHVTMSDGTVFPYNPQTMQKAMDYRINALLVESKIGTMPADALYDPEIAKGKDGIFDIYGKVYKQDQDNNGNGNQGPGQGDQDGQNGFDKGGMLPPGSSTGQGSSAAAAARNPQQWAVEIAAAQQLEDMRSQGKMSAGMRRLFNEILDPVIPWTDHIQAIVNRRVGSSNYDWRRPDRRFIVRDCYLPGRTGNGAGWIVIWGDTSGSRSTKEMEESIAEIAGIIDQTHPKRLTVIWGDADICDVDELEDAADLEAIHSRGAGGGGGTDVEPVFKWIEEQYEAPDLFMGFTDGYLSFPTAPSYPVVWASSTDAPYPYGDVVKVTR